jgi:signal peptidase II
MLPLIITILVTLFDQWTKLWVLDSFRLGESIPVVEGFFHFTYVRNPGAAWGMFGNHNMALVFLSVIMLAIIAIFRRSFLSDTLDHRLALGLMAGGIIGNLIDRIKYGYVVDFLDFNLGFYHWPVFNIADSAICVGVGIYVVSSLWTNAHPLHNQRKKLDVSDA